MLTTQSIQLFYENALCEFSCKFGELTAKAEKGQRMDKEVIAELNVIGVMISSIYGYNTTDEHNCNTGEEILNIIQYIAVKLGICLTELTPVQIQQFPDGIGYMNVAFGDNVQVVG